MALFLETVTLVSQRYLNTLLTALVFTAMADACFIYAFRCGGTSARVFSIACLLPTLFIVTDFVGRVL